MKKQFFYILGLILLISTQTKAQCSTSVSGFGNNTVQPMYNVEGTVTMTINETLTQVTLDLGNDFKTAQGPDVRAYWVNPKNLTNQQLAASKIADLEKISLGIISSDTVAANGAKTLSAPIPLGTAFNEYTKLFFYCEAFDVFWDFGSLESIDPLNCIGVDLGVNDLEFSQQLILYPNPVVDEFNITSNNGSKVLSVEIYNSLGESVEYIPQVSTTIFDVSHLSKGVYFVKVTTDRGVSTTKMVKE